VIAATPAPPYYAVVFTSLRTEIDAGYVVTAAQMLALAAMQPGYLGVESARDAALGITVSYWQSLEAIAAWKAEAAHQIAQRAGQARWYAAYTVRVCKVERDYQFIAASAAGLP
jgi:heme-degrading monooxygenase HmoA